MKTRYARILLLLAAAVTGWLAGCGNDDDTLPDEVTAIERWFSRQQIIPQAEAEQIGESRYYSVQEGVYKYVANRSRPGRPADQTGAAQGDSVEFYFEAYTFTTAPAALPYFTNKRSVVEEKMPGLNPEYWSFEPIRAKIGSSSIIKGVDLALPYCQPGDSVVMLITSDLGYGEELTGVVEKNTTLMWIVNIENVKKQ